MSRVEASRGPCWRSNTVNAPLASPEPEIKGDAMQSLTPEANICPNAGSPAGSSRDPAATRTGRVASSGQLKHGPGRPLRETRLGFDVELWA